jgi:hypothetical protein
MIATNDSIGEALDWLFFGLTWRMTSRAVTG